MDFQTISVYNHNKKDYPIREAIDKKTRNGICALCFIQLHKHNIIIIAPDHKFLLEDQFT